ncbi:MAG TPA: PPC domain-containing protein, partial [Blastocatellia bacterium]|nr:PPC domain-containing protein [Blastocatellia bacterium]
TIQVGGTTPAINFQPLAFGQTITSGLSPDDQVLAAPDGRTYFFDAYRFTAVANTTLAVDLRSSVFDAATMLYKRNAAGTLDLVAVDDDLGGLGDGDIVNDNALLLTAIQESAEYVLFVTSAEDNPNGTGGYTVRLIGNAMQNIAYGATVNGQIAATDLQTSAGDYLDAYWFAGVLGDKVQIRMNSTGFDSLLILNRNTGATVAADDNSAGGTNSLINFTLPETGVYVILATPFAPNLTGAYTLTLTRASGLQREVLGDETESVETVRASRLNSLSDDSRLERFANRRIVVR